MNSRTRCVAFVTMVVGFLAACEKQVPGPFSDTTLARLFAPIDSANRLFDAGNGYVLQAILRDSILTEVRVVPRPYLVALHPEWTEPNRELTAEAYGELLKRLQEYRPFGRLEQRGTKGIMSNTVGRFVDLYESVVIERAQRTSIGGGNLVSLVSLRVAYFRPVKGTIRKLQGPDGIFEDYRVWIGDESYWVHRSTFERLAIRSTATVTAAGPVDDLAR